MKDTEACVGIFGCVVQATIQNLSFKGNINECKNATYLGSIVGYASRTQIVNCHNTAPISGAGAVGGIASYNGHGAIIACSNSGTVTGNSIGGIVAGAGGSDIIGCINTANVMGSSSAGGIGGSCDGIIACWSAASTITSTDDKGGIAGFANKTKYCYWKAIDGISSAISGTSTGNVENCEAFSGDAPSTAQIKAMNDAWQTADADREYQFNATTGMIEKKP